MDHSQQMRSLEEYVIGVVTDQLRLEGRSPEKAASAEPKFLAGLAAGFLMAGIVFISLLAAIFCAAFTGKIPDA